MSTDVSANLDAAVADLAERFRAALEPPGRAGVAITPAVLRARLQEPLPERGTPVEELLDELEEKVAPGLAGTTGPRYFGYVTGGALPGATIAHAWATAVDQNPALWTLAPAAAELEQVVIGWLADLLEMPHASGVFTSGATMANTVSLAVARHWFGKKHGVNVAELGVRALPTSRSTEARSSTSPTTRRCARSGSARDACAGSRSMRAIACAWTPCARLSSATARPASSRRSSPRRRGR